MKNDLLKKATCSALLACLLVLIGCANIPQVRAAYDQNADFTKYKTFAFVNPLTTDRSGYQSIVSQELKAATQRELEARGLRLDSTAPQLLVNFNAALVNITQVRTSPVPINGGLGFYGGSYYGYRGGLYSSWPLYVEETVVFNHKEGTLNIDVIDALRKQLIWEGVVTDSSVTQDELTNLANSINIAVKAAFNKFPVKPTGS
jgi:Domain of unknown function (DUF4136)